MSQYRDLEAITHLVIHCSAAPNGRNDDITDVDQWHGERGFSRDSDFVGNSGLKSIGYHFFIKCDGTIQKGRLLRETGAHARGYNNNSIGICMAGTNHFSPEQWDSLRKNIREIIKAFPRIRVMGHSSVSKKTCPNFSVNDWMKSEILKENTMQDTMQDTQEKPFYKSKTIWFNVAVAMFTAISSQVPLLAEYMSPVAYMFLLSFVSAGNVLLRAITSKQLTTK